MDQAAELVSQTARGLEQKLSVQVRVTLMYACLCVCFFVVVVKVRFDTHDTIFDKRCAVIACIKRPPASSNHFSCTKNPPFKVHCIRRLPVWCNQQPVNFFLSGSLVVTCPSLYAPENGQVSFGNSTYLSVRTFSCNVGYNINGPVNTTCQANGSWSTTAPSCTSKKHFLFSFEKER